MLAFLITSQMTHTKINMNQLMIQFECMPKNTLTEVVQSVIEPFRSQISSRGIKVVISEANQIPDWLHLDWQIYKEIMFHVVQNAVKFNSMDGSLQIILSFHEYESTFEQYRVSKYKRGSNKSLKYVIQSEGEGEGDREEEEA